jgi:hypothetical protein
MTVIEIINAARSILKDPLETSRTFPDDVSSFYKDTDLLTDLNFEQRTIANKLIQSYENYFVTQTTIGISANQDYYSMPTDLIKVLRLEDSTNSNATIELIPTTFNDLDYFQPTIFGISSIGSITHYAMKGNYIVVRPVPATSRTLRLHYCKRLEDLVSGSQSSEIPLEYHEILMWGVIKRALIRGESTPEAMQIAISEYSRLIKDMEYTAEDRQIQRSRTVRRKKYRSK